MKNPHNDEYYIKESFKETYPVFSMIVGLSFVLSILGLIAAVSEYALVHTFVSATVELCLLIAHFVLRFFYSKKYAQFHKDWHTDVEE